MLPFILHIITIIVCLIGISLFVWWWYKIKRATAVYIFIILLLFAELIEKTGVAFLRYYAIMPNDHSMFHEYLNMWWWQYLSMPTAIVYIAIIVTMLRRIFRTNRAVKAFMRKDRPRSACKCALVVSDDEVVNSLLGGVFITNEIACFETQFYRDSIEVILSEKDINIVFFDSRAFNGNISLQQKFISIVKDSKPWTLFIAVSRCPTREDFIEKMRMGFDDYLHIPIKPEVLIASYNRWKARINRWQHIGERRKDGRGRRKKKA